MSQLIVCGRSDADLSDLASVRRALDQARPDVVVNAAAYADRHLLVHADAMLYVNHGMSIDQVNRNFRALLDSDDLRAWETTLASFSEHMAFAGLEMTGNRRAEQILSLYGGDLLVHGHTPIPWARRVEPESVTGPWLYAGERCLNVDGGMYMGSPGFIHRLN